MQTMLEDKLRATDWEATNELIEEQVARESYLQWFKDNERHKKNTVISLSVNKLTYDAVLVVCDFLNFSPLNTCVRPAYLLLVKVSFTRTHAVKERKKIRTFSYVYVLFCTPVSSNFPPHNFLYIFSWVTEPFSKLN